MALSMFAKCRAPCGDVAATDMKRVPDPVDGVGIEVVERSERSDGRPLLPPPRTAPLPFLTLVCWTRGAFCESFFSAPFWLLAPLCGACAAGISNLPSLRRRGVRVSGCPLGVYAAGERFWLVCVAIAVSLARLGSAAGGARERIGSTAFLALRDKECAVEIGGSRGLVLGECVCYLLLRFACFDDLDLGVQSAVRWSACL